MTEELIKIAAYRYQGELIGSVINNTNVDYYEENYEAGRMHALSDYTEKIFIDGADWRINSVWHDASEMPEKKFALVEYDCFPKGHGYLVVPDPREVIRAITRWAYIEDLIPNKDD